MFYKKFSLPAKLITMSLSVLLMIVFFNFLFDSGNIFYLIIGFVFIFASLFFVFNVMESFKLYTKIFMGLALGLLFGVFAGEAANIFYPMGQVFIRLIKMIVIPLVFASVFVGTASLGDPKKLGRIGGKTIGFYILSTAIAIIIGLTTANIIKPGSDIPESVKSELHANYQSQAQVKIEAVSDKTNTIDILLDIVPTNPFKAVAEGKMLQIIFFAILSGIVIHYIADDRKKIIISFFEGVTDLSIELVHLIMKLAPYGVFALIAYVIAQFGSQVILTLISYFLTTLIALLIHVFIFNSVVIKFFTQIKLADFWKGIYPAVLVAFSTSSSSATLPVTMECAEKNLKVKPHISSFVLPLGSTINMDGTAIFQGVSAVFIATLYSIDLTLGDQLTILLTATLASIGTAGAPQVGIIMLTLVLQSIGIPLEGIALILGVERFLDMARTTVNITSDLSCAGFVNAKE
jgi:Na+/H+-dicarboxylate symporter